MDDKIREAFEDKTKEFNFSKRTSKDKALGWFRKGYKSASAELEKQIEKMKCCGNCKYPKGHSSIPCRTCKRWIVTGKH